jgi:hypothetical protein
VSTGKRPRSPALFRSARDPVQAPRRHSFYVFLAIVIGLGVFAGAYMLANLDDGTTANEGGALVDEPLDDGRNQNDEGNRRSPG